MNCVLVTGATGYLGSTLSSFLSARGLRVVRALRDVGGAQGEAIPLLLGSRTPAAEEIRARSIDAVVHCAHDFSALSWEETLARNVEGTLALARAAAAGGVRRQVFISTLSAFPGCISRYGRAKLATERGLEKMGVVVVRPGLLYDEHPRGLVGTMQRVAARSPIIPLIGSGRQLQYTCHVQDLCACVLELLEVHRAEAPLGPVVAAHPEPLAFKEIVARLAASTGRRRPLFLPVPWRLVWAGLRVLEGLGLRIGLRSDSVLGLQFAVRSPDFDHQALLRASFRPFQPGVRPSAREGASRVSGDVVTR